VGGGERADLFLVPSAIRRKETVKRGSAWGKVRPTRGKKKDGTRWGLGPGEEKKKFVTVAKAHSGFRSVTGWVGGGGGGKRTWDLRGENEVYTCVDGLAKMVPGWGRRPVLTLETTGQGGEDVKDRLWGGG